MANPCSMPAALNPDRVHSPMEFAMPRLPLSILAAAVCGLVTLLAGCKPVDPLADLWQKPRPQASTSDECARLHGLWFQPAGADARAAFCIVPTPDAGKACLSTSDCATFCEEVRGRDPAAPARGICHANYDYRGCFALVEDGERAGRVCID